MSQTAVNHTFDIKDSIIGLGFDKVNLSQNSIDSCIGKSCRREDFGINRLQQNPDIGAVDVWIVAVN